MIQANILKNSPFNIAFTSIKNIPEDILLHRKNTAKVTAKIDKKDQIIEIYDFRKPIKFESLQLEEFIIKLGTGKSFKAVQKLLLKSYGEKIKNQDIYIVLYKLA